LTSLTGRGIIYCRETKYWPALRAYLKSKHNFKTNHSRTGALARNLYTYHFRTPAPGGAVNANENHSHLGGNANENHSHLEKKPKKKWHDSCKSKNHANRNYL